MPWVVSEFSAEQAFGRVRDLDTGREAVFPLEAWMPCDPKTARDLDDSDRRRHLLLPRVGEPVDVTWKKGYRGVDVPSRVVRTRPIGAVLPQRTLRDWLRAMAVHVPALAHVTAESLQALAPDIELDETTDSPTPLDPVQHLALLAYIQQHDESRAIELRWIVGEGTPHAVALEGGAEHPIVHVALPPESINALVEAELVLRA
jgi:hypothetical protein